MGLFFFMNLNQTTANTFASVYIHFVMDRAIFRFSDAAVRKVSVPLLLNAGVAT